MNAVNVGRMRVIALLTGAAMGLLAGLLGVGGGIVAVPLMTAFLALTQHEAHGTSLAVIVPAALFSVARYASDGKVDWQLAAFLAGGSIVGVSIGCRLMMRIPARQLKRYFGVLLLVVAIRLFVGNLWPALGSTETAHATDLATLIFASLIGLAAGVLAGMMGIGGGVVMVPAMVLLLGIGQRVAQGVSLAVVAATAVIGSVQHYKQGNVRLDRALWIAPTAAIFGFIGASAAGWLDQQLLQNLFGVLLLGVGGKMVLGK